MRARKRDYRPGSRQVRASVSVRVWYPVRTLGKLAVVACLLRVRGVPNAGIGEASSLLLTKTMRMILRGATDAEIEAAVSLIPSAFPRATQAAVYGRRAVIHRLSPRETPGTDNNLSDSSRVG